MAKTSSAKKANRRAARRAVFNMRTKRAMKSAVRAVSDATQSKGENTATLLSKAYAAVDKAAKRGVVKKNTAARMKSRLSRQFPV